MVDRSGAPQANATVELFKFDRDWRYWKKAGREVHCDSKGTATCGELPDESANIVRVTAGHNLLAYREFTLTDETPQQEGTVKVEPQAAMSIRVHDEKGNAIEGAGFGRLTIAARMARSESIALDLPNSISRPMQALLMVNCSCPHCRLESSAFVLCIPISHQPN